MHVAAFPLMALLAAGTPPAADEFAATLPEGVADVSGWELISGEFRTPGLLGSYRFYVNPARQALYQVMRFRTAPGEPPLAPERVAFVARPGATEPMLCWVRNAPGSPVAWRALDPASEEYRGEMVTLMRVISAHRTSLGLGSPQP